MPELQKLEFLGEGTRFVKSGLMVWLCADDISYSREYQRIHVRKDSDLVSEIEGYRVRQSLVGKGVLKETRLDVLEHQGGLGTLDTNEMQVYIERNIPKDADWPALIGVDEEFGTAWLHIVLHPKIFDGLAVHYINQRRVKLELEFGSSEFWQNEKQYHSGGRFPGHEDKYYLREETFGKIDNVKAGLLSLRYFLKDDPPQSTVVE